MLKYIIFYIYYIKTSRQLSKNSKMVARLSTHAPAHSHCPGDLGSVFLGSAKNAQD